MGCSRFREKSPRRYARAAFTFWISSSLKPARSSPRMRRQKPRATINRSAARVCRSSNLASALLSLSAASAIVGAALLTVVTTCPRPSLPTPGPQPVPTDGSASHLIDDLDYQTVDTAVVARKLPKQGRCNVVINVVRIQVICQIERVHTEPNFPLRRPAYERQAQRKLAIDSCVQGEERGEAQAVWRAHIILQDIHRRIRQPRVHVDHRTQGQFPWKIYNPPTHNPVGHIGGEHACHIRADDRLLKGHKGIREGVQVASGAAPDVGNIQIGVLERSSVDGGFDTAVA